MSHEAQPWQTEGSVRGRTESRSGPPCRCHSPSQMWRKRRLKWKLPSRIIPRTCLSCPTFCPPVCFSLKTQDFQDCDPLSPLPSPRRAAPTAVSRETPRPGRTCSPVALQPFGTTGFHWLWLKDAEATKADRGQVRCRTQSHLPSLKCGPTGF